MESSEKTNRSEMCYLAYLVLTAETMLLIGLFILVLNNMFPSTIQALGVITHIKHCYHGGVFKTCYHGSNDK